MHRCSPERATPMTTAGCGSRRLRFSAHSSSVPLTYAGPLSARIFPGAPAIRRSWRCSCHVCGPARIQVRCAAPRQDAQDLGFRDPDLLHRNRLVQSAEEIPLIQLVNFAGSTITDGAGELAGKASHIAADLTDQTSASFPEARDWSDTLWYRLLVLCTCHEGLCGAGRKVSMQAFRAKSQMRFASPKADPWLKARCARGHKPGGG